MKIKKGLKNPLIQKEDKSAAQSLKRVAHSCHVQGVAIYVKQDYMII